MNGEAKENIKGALVVLLILAAMTWADTDEFRHQCENGNAEFCVDR